jgi:hypothetical protein
MNEQPTLTLCGIEFETAGQAVTARQDDYLMAQLRLAGVLDVVQEMKDEDVEAKSSELLTRILLCGRAPEILAGLLVESGKKWNLRRAEKLAELFGDATNPEDKELMRKSIVSFVIGFFRFGDRSSTISPKSSVPNDAEVPTESAEASISETSPA